MGKPWILYTILPRFMLWGRGRILVRTAPGSQGTRKGPGFYVLAHYSMSSSAVIKSSLTVCGMNWHEHNPEGCVVRMSGHTVGKTKDGPDMLLPPWRHSSSSDTLLPKHEHCLYDTLKYLVNAVRNFSWLIHKKENKTNAKLKRESDHSNNETMYKSCFSFYCLCNTGQCNWW